jgi:predicted deacylase
VSTVDRDCVSIAPFTGHYESLVACGAMVTRGTVVGLVHDFEHIDDAPYEVRAAVDGFLLCQAWRATVTQGQHIVCIGRVVG